MAAALSAFPSFPWPNRNPNQQQQLPCNKDDNGEEEEQQVHYHDDKEKLHDEKEYPVHKQQSLLPNPNLKTPNSQKPASALSSLVHVSFNQDHGCFACSIDHGFRIYGCDPFRELLRRDWEKGGGGEGGIGIVEMLFCSNIIALVRSGRPDPPYTLKRVMIWDDNVGRCNRELNFRTEVRGVRLRRDRIIVVLEQKIYVYNLDDLKLLIQIVTYANPKGLCQVSQESDDNFVLVCPGFHKGQVRVDDYVSNKTRFIQAHDSRIACFGLARDGHMLATASTKGTLVRIFNTHNGTLLQEVRRGADRAEIYSLSLSSTAEWLAVSSDKGTVHVFSVKSNQRNQVDETNEPSEQNPPASPSSSSLSFIKGVVPKYFRSEWSVAQFRLVEGCRYVVAFGHQKNTVVILGRDGSFYRCKFDPTTGGMMTQLEHHNFLKPEDAL